MRWPGIEPGSTAWKAAMLTTIPPTHTKDVGGNFSIYSVKSPDRYHHEIEAKLIGQSMMAAKP